MTLQGEEEEEEEETKQIPCFDPVLYAFYVSGLLQIIKATSANKFKAHMAC